MNGEKKLECLVRDGRSCGRRRRSIYDHEITRRKIHDTWLITNFCAWKIWQLTLLLVAMSIAKSFLSLPKVSFTILFLYFNVIRSYCTEKLFKVWKNPFIVSKIGVFTKVIFLQTYFLVLENFFLQLLSHIMNSDNMSSKFVI